MIIEPTDQEIKALESIWLSQRRSKGPLLNFSKPIFELNGIVSSKLEIINALNNFLIWPEWVILFIKPAYAILALNKLLKSQRRHGGVLWIAPGNGAPFQTPHVQPGLAILRTDWTPDHQSLICSLEKIKSQDLYLVVDESYTGLRLAQGGATEYYNLTPNAVLYGPALAGGQNFAALAGRGPIPTTSFLSPSSEALAATAAYLKLASSLDIPNRLKTWGRALALGLSWFAKRAQLANEITCEGPLALLRLKGQHIATFIELCRDEGLNLGPLILANPTLDPILAEELLWPRLCRAIQRLKTLSRRKLSVYGWNKAYEINFL